MSAIIPRPVPEGPKPKYNPADQYLALTDRSAGDLDILRPLIGKLAPFLAIRVLKHRERWEVVEQISRVMKGLRKKYALVLCNHGMERLGALVEGSEGIYDPIEICRHVEDADNRALIHTELARIRDHATADILECLGFLPSDLFTRDKVETKAAPNGENGETHVFLQELFPAWFRPEYFSKPLDLLPHVEAANLSDYKKYAQLAEWISTSRTEFDESINQAYLYLKKNLLPVLAPEGSAGQAWEPVEDLSTQSLVALLETVLDTKLPLRRRFEAFRLIEWSCALFSIKRNPIFKAQQKVRRGLHDLLQIEVWESRAKFSVMRVHDDLVRTVKEEETGARTGPHTTRYTSRKIHKAFQALFDLYRGTVVDEHTTDRVRFSSREKDAASSALKIFLLQEMCAKSLATLRREKTGLTRKQALVFLRTFRERAIKRGRHMKDFRVKPVEFNSLDDQVGFTIGVNLSKRLDEFGDGEKAIVDDFFAQFAHKLGLLLGLKEVETENSLWDHNTGNPRSHKGFRIFKLHGTYEIETEVFVNGAREIRNVAIPVEIQIHPMESNIRALFEGPTGRIAYELKKTKGVARAIAPYRIGTIKVYEPNPELDALEQLLNEL